MELFKIVLPTPDVEHAENMYYRSENGEMVYDKEEGNHIKLNTGDEVSFDNYFNLFSYQKYLRYTKVKKVKASLKFEGKVTISLMVHKSWKYMRNGYTSETIQKKLANSEDMESVELEWDFSKEKLRDKTCERYNSVGIMPNRAGIDVKGFCYLKVTALSDNVKIYGGSWYIDDDIEENPVRLAIGICTFKREEYVIRNTQMMKELLSDSTETSIRGELDIFVSDNGKTLKRKMKKSEHINLFYNRNYGGSGGFTRTLMEVWYRREEFTHILLMDDDVVIEPNILRRTISFLRVLSEEYVDAHIGGSMLHITNPCYQYEMGSRWSGNRASSFHRWDLSTVNRLIDNEIEENVNFNGWFYTCMPISVIEKNGLPFPFFIKGDDIEYGIRNADKVIMMNGIGVWHEPYVLKFSNHLKYFDYRNKLVVKAVHAQNGEVKDILKDFKQKCTESLYRQQYDAAEYYMLAMEDYLKGIDFFLNQKEDRYLKKLLRIRKTEFLTEEELREKGYHFNRLEFEKPKKKKNWFIGFIDKITLNGNLLPKIFYQKDLKIVDFGEYKPEQYARCKKLLQWSPMRKKGMVTHANPKRFRKLKWRMLGVQWKIRTRYKKVSSEYVRRANEITSLSYWEKHLGLPITCDSNSEQNVCYHPNVIIPRIRKTEFCARMERVRTSEIHRRDYVDVAYGNIHTFFRKILRKLKLTKLSRNMRILQQFKNIHEGKRCFIVCPGPSLRMSDLKKLKDEYTFGVNSIYHAYEKTDWRPTYYVMCDASGYRRQEASWDFESFSKEKVFLNNRILYWQKGFTDKTVPFIFNHRTSEHYKAPTIPMRSDKDIDVCIYDRGTVTNAAIDIALYMGFKKIYLIGVDHNYQGKKRHFVATEDDMKRSAPSNAHMQLTEEGYWEGYMNARRHEAQIVNCTRGGKLEVFPRETLEDVLGIKKKPKKKKRKKKVEQEEQIVKA
ncbi:MAG: DUF115 domain-containing protein [Lachnospiraceae bacterium]